MIRPCICCNSVLRYPAQAMCFRCSLCMTVNDVYFCLSGSQIKKKASTDGSKFISVEHFVETIHQTRSALQLAKQRTGNVQAIVAAGLPLRELISLVFGSPPILNKLFLVKNGGSIQSSGLNYKLIYQLYHDITNLDILITNELLRAIESLLRRPMLYCHDPADYQYLLILLENPLLNSKSKNIVNKSSSILKRILGVLSNLNEKTHHFFISCFKKQPYNNPKFFRRKVDLINKFIGQRLMETYSRNKRKHYYNNDWQIKSAAITMALLYSANSQMKLIDRSSFYCIMADFINLYHDFELWEQKINCFCFCQYPFLLSMGAKISILQLDARRKMEIKAREAFFSSILSKMNVEPYLMIRVRRDRLLEDSLRQINDRNKDFRKALKVEFLGEEGIDAGGLKREWLLLLTRKVFSPEFGLFVNCEESSNYLWFNYSHRSKEIDYYHMSGILMGIAIHNSINLDVQMPRAFYKKLLQLPLSFNDLDDFQPSLYRGLKELLLFEGDVKNTYGLNFTINLKAVEGFRTVELKEGGSELSVDNENRKEYVLRYVEYLLNTTVKKQFSAFFDGFMKVCGGNAISLFQDNEISKLIRGSEEVIDWELLKNVCVYDFYDQNAISNSISESEPSMTASKYLCHSFVSKRKIILWFWDLISHYSLKMQKLFLIFVTGSDRIPATGAHNFQLRISVLGPDSDQLPISHTCFNHLCIWEYSSREKLKKKLDTALLETNGFNIR